MIETDKIEKIDSGTVNDSEQIFYIPHFITKQKIRRSVLDLVRLVQTCYFGAENVRMIARHGYTYTLSHCKKVYRKKCLN